MMQDVIIIGGSYSGMAAGLQLLRAHKHVTIIDDGQRRNRFSEHSHGFLGQDGTSAADIASSARSQLETYPTLSWAEGRAVTISGEKGDFRVTAADGQAFHGSAGVAGNRGV